MNSLKQIILLVIAFCVSLFPGGCSPQYMAEQLRTMAQQIEDKVSNSKEADNGAFVKATQVDESPEPDDRGIAFVSKDRPRHALIIGNAQYKHVPALLNPNNDAYDMKRALEKLGFQVTYLPNAENRRVMTEAVRRFGDRLARSENGVGLFFYAGHAMQIYGVNYLIPVDAVINCEADVEFETFNVNYLLQTMDQAKNGMNIVMLDACRNNPFARGFRSVARGLAPMDSPTGSIIAFATAPGRTAEDGIGRNGTFTKNLLQYIDKPNLTIEQLLKNVRIEVIGETKGAQTPWETSSLRGDFCFAGCQDQAMIKRDLIRQAEEDLKNKMSEEYQRLEKERAFLETERARIEAKKLDMKSRVDDAQRQRDRETLNKIREEQASLTEQRRLLKKEQNRIEQQKAILNNKNTNNSEKEKEIARLKQEQEKFEKERAELELLRAEAEKERRLAEEAHRRAEAARKARENGRRRNENRPTAVPTVGF